MFAPPIAAVLTAQAGPLFAKWFPQPTGANGLEELIRVADMLSTDRFLVFEAWKPRDSFPLDMNPLRHIMLEKHRKMLAEPDAVALEGQTKGMEFADLCELETQQFGSALDLIRQANSKPLIPLDDPVTAGSLDFNLGTACQGSTNIAMRAAFVDFRKGRTREAVHVLCNQVQLYDRLQRISATGGTRVPFDIDSLASLIATHLGQLDATDCQDLHEFLSGFLQAKPALIDEMDRMAGFWQARIRDYVKQESIAYPGPRTKAPEGMIDDWLVDDEVTKMTDAQRQALVSAAQDKAKEAFPPYLARFSGPESQWGAPLPDNPYMKYGGVSNTDELASRVAAAVRPQALITRITQYLRARTRLRLLDTHAQILLFRWKKGRLPITLEEAAKGLSTDPLTDGQLKYKVQADGTYDLYSEGNAATGVIRLRPEPPAAPLPSRAHP